MSTPDHNPNEAPEIIPADPKARVTAIVVALAIVAAGAVAFWWLSGFKDELLRLAQTDRAAAIAKALWLADVVSLTGGIGLVAAGLYFGLLGRRIRRSGRYPPPGMKVIRATRLQTGPRARLMASVATWSALFFILLGTLGMWYFRTVARAILGG